MKDKQLNSDFELIWKSQAKEAAQNVILNFFLNSEKKRPRAYFRKNKNGGSFWLEIREPNQDIRLIDIELQKEIAPLTLRFRVWFYCDEKKIADKYIEAGSIALGEESIAPYKAPLPKSWRTKLENSGVLLEGVEYPVRNTEFLFNDVHIESTIEGLLSDLCKEIENIKNGTKSYSDSGTLFPDEIDVLDSRLSEGAVTRISVNKYERNRRAREACIRYHKAVCSVCKFNFSEVYGEIGKDFIHVHHLIALSAISKEYKVDPEKDLIPVCPNCHAMLHQRKPSLSIEELKRLIKC